MGKEAILRNATKKLSGTKVRMRVLELEEVKYPLTDLEERRQRVNEWMYQRMTKLKRIQLSR